MTHAISNHYRTSSANASSPSQSSSLRNVVSASQVPVHESNLRETYKIRTKSNILSIPERNMTFTYDRSSLEKAESITYDSSFYNLPTTQALPSTVVTIKLEEHGTTKLKFVLHHLHPVSCELLREVDTLCHTKPRGWEARFFSFIQQVESCAISLRHAAYGDTKISVDPWIESHCKADEDLLQKLSAIFKDRVLMLYPSSLAENAEILMAWAQALMIRAYVQPAPYSNKAKAPDSSSICEAVGTLKLGDMHSCSLAFHKVSDPSLTSLNDPHHIVIKGPENLPRTYTLHHQHPSRWQILRKILKVYQHKPDQLPVYFQKIVRACKTCADSLKQASQGNEKIVTDPWLRREYKADKAMLRFLINLGLKLSGTKTGD